MLVLNKNLPNSRAMTSKNKNQNLVKKNTVNFLAMPKSNPAALWSKWDEEKIELLKK